MDAVALSEQVTPWVTAAVSYSTALLTQAKGVTATESVWLGLRVLQHITDSSSTPSGFQRAVAELATDPDSVDIRGAVRSQIKRALQTDPDLAAALTHLVGNADRIITTASGNRSVGTQTINGNVHTGDTHHHHLRGPHIPLPPASSIEAPTALHNLPPFHGPVLGRENDLAHLHQAVRDGNSVITQAVHGLGGIGKSTLALNYARTHQHTRTLTWWITADTPQNLVVGLAALAERLHGHIVTDSINATWALTWLQTHPGWLLVLDNVEDPADLEPFLGQLDTGHVLITSRRATGWHHLAHPLAIDVLDLEAATDLLAHVSSHHGQNHRPALRALASELGCLPLALAQAGAYIARHRISVSDYHQRLREHPTRIHATPTVPGQYERSVARTWNLTLETIASGSPLAVGLLAVLAWLAPDELPRNVLTPFNDDALAIDEALGLLADYSMITLTRDAVSVHRLVQSVTRTSNTRGQVRHAQHQAAALLESALPPKPRVNVDGWPRWQVLLPHIQAYAALTRPEDDTTSAYVTYHEAALFLATHGQVDQALEYAQRALIATIRIHGPNDPRTLLSRNDLARIHREAGDLRHAIALHEDTLADQIRALGPHHPHTINSRNDLAHAYLDAGDLDRATPLLEDTLADREQTLGHSHPDTLVSRNGLANAYLAAGNPCRAIPLFEDTLAGRRRLLGPDHLHTINSRNDLAHAYLDAGDLDRATPLLEDTLADRERLLGPHHPHTINSRNNLAHAYSEAGDLTRAIPLYESAARAADRVLGPKHPTARAIHGNLDHTLSHPTEPAPGG